jgi:hypothetical protein
VTPISQNHHPPSTFFLLFLNIFRTAKKFSRQDAKDAKNTLKSTIYNSRFQTTRHFSAGKPSRLTAYFKKLFPDWGQKNW